nr:hypothetical protein [Tanacetum cinerariifolium]GFB54752.1 hypothetical protein [Tanacetum cinerariifolium]
QRQDSMPPSSLMLTEQYGVIHTVSQELVAFFHLVLKVYHIRKKDLNDFKSKAFQVLRTGTSDDGINQAGSGVVGHSSSRGFHQSCLKFTLGIWSLWTDFLDWWMEVEVVVVVALGIIRKLQELPK